MVNQLSELTVVGPKFIQTQSQTFLFIKRYAQLGIKRIVSNIRSYKQYKGLSQPLYFSLVYTL